MIGTRIGTTASAASLVLCVLGGCVLREERITIARDGGVRIELEITGSEEELKSGDAMPSAVGEWKVDRRLEDDDDGEKLVVKSSRHIEPGEALPWTLAAPNDPNAELYLDFPTELRVERREDGIYYIFHRTYTPRRWAHTQYWYDVFFDGDIKRLAETPLKELGRDEQREIIKAFASVEAFRQLEFAGAALVDTAEDFPIEDALRARSALLSVYNKFDLLADDNSPKAFGEAMLAPVEPRAEGEGDGLDRVIERCEALSDAERDVCYDDAATELFDEAFVAYTASLRDSNEMTNAAVERFERSYKRAKKRHEITDALGGQHFETIVLMPGTIVAHNANEVKRNDEESQTSAEWRFNGNAFRDRTQELWAVSRVTWDEDGRMRSPEDDDDR